MPCMPGRSSCQVTGTCKMERVGLCSLCLRVSLSWLEGRKMVRVILRMLTGDRGKAGMGGASQESTVLLSAIGDKMDKHSERPQHTRYRMVLLPILTLSRCPTYLSGFFFFNKLKISKLEILFCQRFLALSSLKIPRVPENQASTNLSNPFNFFSQIWLKL